MDGDPAPVALTRCPACSAAVRPEAPWCTQCYTDLRPPPPPAPVSPVVPPPGVDAAAQVPRQALGDDTSPVVPVPGPLVDPTPAAAAVPSASWPCTTCGASNPLAAAECSACGSGFLAAVRSSEEPLLVIPGLGDLSRYSRAQRLGLASGFVLCVAVLVVVVGLLL